MNAKVFLDTNVLVYYYSIDDPEKRDFASALIVKHEEVIVSTQTLNEFIHVMHRKKKISIDEIKKTIEIIIKFFRVVDISIFTVELALTILEEYRFSYFDSLMVASAFENKCLILFTEDMHHSQVIFDELTIINPFK